ncbi:MAG: aldo/keto reductase [Phycisphaerae bacterium SM23_33]|nr:MAG: aldo/keto reductase [Phycisphaerae bacterium SM23_33]
MQYTTLGRTGVQVSRLCFGTMSFGGDADEDTSAKMFRRCREAGINFFDSANIYSRGRAEEILGGLIRSCRDELVITSKVCGAMGPGANDRGLSRRHILAQVEGSLRRLGTDRLDVYFCHHSDPAVPVAETLRTMDDLVRQGKVLYLGVSNWTAWQTARALGISQRLHLAGVHVLQPMYNLAKRTAEVEILPLAAAEGLAVTPYSPLGGGLLTGKYTTQRKDEKGRLATNKNYSIRYGRQVYYEVAERFSDYAKKAGVHPATLAVAWVKAHPAITAPIIGARNMEQLEASLAAADYEMSPRQYEEIAALTPPVPMATDRDEERPA